MEIISTLIFLIGAFDAMLIMLLGSAAAGIYLFGLAPDYFWNRFAPACGWLIGASVAAGIVMAIMQWMAGIG